MKLHHRPKQKNMTPADAGSSNSQPGSSGHQDSGSNNGFSVVAHTLAKLGIKHMYGVVGIPVTELASAAQVSCKGVQLF